MALQSVVEVVLGAVNTGVRTSQAVHFAIVQALCKGKEQKGREVARAVKFNARSFHGASRFNAHLSCRSRCKSWAFPSRPPRRRNSERRYYGGKARWIPRMVWVRHNRSSPANRFGRSLGSASSWVPSSWKLCFEERYIHFTRIPLFL